MKADVLQDGHAWVVLEPDVSKLDIAVDVGDFRPRRVLLVLRRHVSDLAYAIEARERFGDLRADIGELDDRHGDHRDHRQIPHEVADRHRVGANRRAADEHHRDADGADDDARERADRRDTRQRLRDVSQQMGQPDVARDSNRLRRLNREYQQTDARLRQLYSEWERVAGETTNV